jgi:hypothetical protein
MKNSKFFLFLPVFLMIFFGMFGVLVSNVLIETGGYISEQERFGFYNSSTLIYTSWALFSLLAVYLISQLYRPLRANDHDQLLKYNKNRFDFVLLRSACALTVFTVVVWGIKAGFPLLGGIDRFIYWSTKNHLFEFIYGQFFLISFFLGWLYFSNKLFSILLFSTVLLTHVLFSNKFSGIVFSLYLYFLPWFLFGMVSLRLKQYVKIFSLLAMLFIPFLYFIYFTVYGVANPVEFFFKVSERAVLQGHVFWGTINLHDNLFFFDSSILTNELLGSYGFSDDHYGMRNLMVEISGKIGERRIDQGADFTMAYPAVIYNFSGIIGIFFAQAFFLLLFSFLIFSAVHCMKKLYILCLVPIVKLIIDFIGFFGIGDLDLVFGYKNILYLSSFAFLYLFYYVLSMQASQKHKY